MTGPAASVPIPGHDPATVLLRTDGVTKSFGGVHALKGVDFELRSGEVHALLGENGAGKSTFVKIISGQMRADEGSLRIGDRTMDAAHQGSTQATNDVAVVHQELSIVPTMTVLDNLFLGHPAVGFLYRRRELRRRGRAALDRIGLGSLNLDSLAGSLPLAERQLIEIARAVTRDARIVILDEPTATLSDAEIERVFGVVRELRARGHAVVYISHRLKEIFALADRATVFRDGRRISTEPVADLTPDLLVERIIGRNLVKERSQIANEDHAQPRSIRLDVKNLTCQPTFRDVSLSVAVGEIVGVVGQIGSGADDLIRSLAGARPPQAGSMLLDGEPYTPNSIRQALSRGVSFVSDDRAKNGVFLDVPINHNLTSMVLSSVVRGGIVRSGDERRVGKTLAKRFTIDARRLRSAANQLSGGNQQKVSLGKSAAMDPRLLLLNEPTRGVDVGARSEIYRLLRQLADEGAAVLLFSSDLAEVVEICDRVVTFFHGRAVTELKGADITEQSLLQGILNPEEVPL